MLLTTKGSKNGLKLMRKFAALGPYLRESKCSSDVFFFDCLAVCLNTQSAPDKREFWGWWIKLVVTEKEWTYSHWYGLYDKRGEWQQPDIEESEVRCTLESTLSIFLSRLQQLAKEMELCLTPAEDTEQRIYSVS